MKLAFTLLLLVSATIGASVEENDKSWDQYKKTYGKIYLTGEDEIRKNIFMSNKKSVEEHYKLFINGQSSFSTKLNKFSDWLPYETERLRGFKMSDDGPQTNYTFLPADEDVKIPDAIDWRLKGAVTPIKNQGYCVADWSFSASGSLEGQHFLKTGELVSLSEQNLIDCDELGSSCHGGDMTAAFLYVKRNGGIDTEESYPYLGKDDKYCHFNAENIGATSTGFVKIAEGDEAALEIAVATVGPISAAINDFGDAFDYYSGGIYSPDYCDPNGQNHAVLIVGYGVSSDGTPYWIVKNSWGTDWGEDGYIRVIKGKNMCGIAMTASYPLV